MWEKRLDTNRRSRSWRLGPVAVLLSIVTLLSVVAPYGIAGAGPVGIASAAEPTPVPADRPGYHVLDGDHAGAIEMTANDVTSPGGGVATSWGQYLGDANNTALRTADGPTGPREYLKVAWVHDTWADSATTPGGVVVDEGVGYYLDYQDATELVALDMATGAVLWNRSVGDLSDYSDDFSPGDFYTGDYLAVGDDHVFVTVKWNTNVNGAAENSSVVALDRTTGSTAWSVDNWRVPRETSTSYDLGAFNTFGFVVPSGDSVYAFTSSDIVRLHQSNGTAAWVRDEVESGLSGLIRAPPVVAEGSVYAMYSNGSVRHVRAFDASDGSDRWTVEESNEIHTPLAVRDATVYYATSTWGTGEPLSNNRIVGIDAATGSESLNASAGGEVEVDALAVGDSTVVYMETTDNVVAGMDVASGTVTWTFDPSGFPSGDGAIVLNDTVYFLGSHPDPDRELLYALDLKTGEKRWQYAVDDAVDSPLSYGDGRLVVPGKDITAITDRTVAYSNFAVPGPVTIGEGATVTVDVTNTGGATESHETNLYEEGRIVETKTGSLAPGETKTVMFDVSYDYGGEYDLRVADLPSQALVVGGAPAWPEPGGDAGDTGHLANGTGPNGNVSESWNRSFSTNAVYSSPVVDGTAFVAAADDLYALNATGATEWSAASAVTTRSTVPPVYADGVVYAFSYDNVVVAFDASDGTELWTYASFDQIPAQAHVQGAAIENDTLYVTFDGGDAGDDYVYAIDIHSRTERWAVAFGSTGIAAGPVVTDGYVVVRDRSTRTWILNASDGSETQLMPTGSSLSDPIASDGVLFTPRYQFVNSAFQGYALAYDLDAVVSGGSGPLWNGSFPSATGIPKAAALADDTLYVGTHVGHLTALNASTGAVEWTYEQPPVVGEAFDDLVVADGVVYYTTDDAETLVAVQNGSSRWNLTFDDGLNWPALADCTLYGTVDSNPDVFVALTGDACGATGTDTAGSDAGGSGGGAGGPDIAVSPGTLDLGTVDVGNSTAANVTVSNTGGAPLDITDVTITGSNASAFQTPAGPTVVDAGVDWNVSVTFTPLSAGPRAANLTVHTNDSDEPAVAVSLSGVGQTASGGQEPEPDISVTPTSHDYGNVTVGSTASASVLVENVGTAPLSIEAPMVTASGLFSSTAPFTITSGGDPHVLPAGSNRTITVEFAPETSGSNSVDLFITSNDTHESVVSVSLVGNGVPASSPGDPPAPSSGTITGTVVDQADTPLSGVLVTGYGPTGTNSTTTDTNGDFSLSVEPGFWGLDFSKSGYGTTSAFVEVNASETESVSVTLEAPGTITGMVVDGSDTPVQGATVSAWGVSSGTTQTDANGQFSLDVAAGDYFVEANRSGFSTDRARDVEVAAGGTTTLTFTLTRPGYVTGTVLEEGGSAASNAYVMADGGGETTFGRTNASGAFNLSVSPGSYTISAFEASGRGMTTASGSIAVDGGTTADAGTLRFVTPDVLASDVSYAGGTRPDMSNVSVSADVQGGMMLVQLVNESASAGPGMPHDLGGLGADDTTVLEITLTVDDYDPSALLWGARNVSWTATPNGTTPGATDLTIRTRTVHLAGIDDPSLPVGPLQFTSPDQVQWPQGPQDRANLGWENTVYFVVYDLSNVPAGVSQDLAGMTVVTNAQTFSRPQMVDDALRVYAAGPHFTTDGDVHDGFYSAFVPDAQLDAWGVDDPETELAVSWAGDPESFTVEETAGGAWIHLDVHYSDGYAEIKPDDSGSSGPSSGGSTGSGGSSSSDSSSSGGATSSGDDGADERSNTTTPTPPPTPTPAPTETAPPATSRRATTTPAEPAPTAGPTTTTNAPGQPGLGVGVAVVAIVAAGLLGRRRRR